MPDSHAARGGAGVDESVTPHSHIAPMRASNARRQTRRQLTTLPGAVLGANESAASGSPTTLGCTSIEKNADPDGRTFGDSAGANGSAMPIVALPGTAQGRTRLWCPMATSLRPA